jgi:hypothetical protein
VDWENRSDARETFECGSDSRSVPLSYHSTHLGAEASAKVTARRSSQSEGGINHQQSAINSPMSIIGVSSFRRHGFEVQLTLFRERAELLFVSHQHRTEDR